MSKENDNTTINLYERDYSRAEYDKAEFIVLNKVNCKINDLMRLRFESFTSILSKESYQHIFLPCKLYQCEIIFYIGVAKTDTIKDVLEDQLIVNRFIDFGEWFLEKQGDQNE